MLLGNLRSFGRLLVFSYQFGRLRTPSDASGRLRTPPDASGRLRTPFSRTVLRWEIIPNFSQRFSKITALLPDWKVCIRRRRILKFLLKQSPGLAENSRRRQTEHRNNRVAKTNMISRCRQTKPHGNCHKNK